jgi:hypothetical protein
LDAPPILRRAGALALLGALWVGLSAGILAGEQLEAWQVVQDDESRVESRLASTLRARFPELPERASRHTLERLLTEADAASGEQRAALLLAADFVAARLAPTDHATPAELDGEVSGGKVARTVALGGRSIRWLWSPLGTSWASDHALLWAVWREQPDTVWGEEAFLLLLRRGWRTTVFCGERPDEFRAVIREGEQFLAAHPRTRLRAPVVLALAWAYETWWSASRARPGQGYVDDPGVYAAGAAEARTHAIARYDEALRLGIASPLAGDARRRLVRLRQGTDTEQRIFYCAYN